MVLAPSTENEYEYISGASGPTVADQTPRSSLVMVGRWPPHSPFTVTVVALGAYRRKTTVRSDFTSGEVTRGGVFGCWAEAATAQARAAMASAARVRGLMTVSWRDWRQRPRASGAE